jgi:GT2 family glycosyltransferase
VSVPHETDLVTVVVATQNRWADLEQTLARHRARVVLVDNGSTDGTPRQVARCFPHVDVVPLGENRGAVARNVGVQRAGTPYVAFADDDSWWAPGALACAAELFDENPRLAVLAGKVLVGAQERVDPVSVEMAGSPLDPDADLPGPSILGFAACGAIVRREAYLEAGGFDDVIFFMGEEERLALDLAARGWGLAYVDEVVAHHHPSPSRDPHRRSVLAARNHLLTAVMRRPWPVVARRFGSALRDRDLGRDAARAALPRLPRALAHRRAVTPEVEAQLRLLGR